METSLALLSNKGASPREPGIVMAFNKNAKTDGVSPTDIDPKVKE